MAAIVNFLCLVFLLSLVGKNTCQCTGDQLKITQAQTGELIQDVPEWNVILENQCPCSHLGLTLNCQNFQTAKEIDSSIVAKSGVECLVNNGMPIYPLSTFNFTYAWDTSCPFEYLSSRIACS